MSPRTKGKVLILAIAVGLPGALLVVLPVQGLPRAHVGVVGGVEGGLPSPVKLTISLPSGAGLTPAEQRAGLPGLNGPQTASVQLGPSFVVDLQRPILYCVTTFPLWQKLPPPDLWLTLRFEDAPGEEHLVGSQGHYVRGVTDEDAVWGVEVRGLERDEDGQTPPRYRLRLRLTRRHQAPHIPCVGESPETARIWTWDGALHQRTGVGDYGASRGCAEQPTTELAASRAPNG